MDTLLVRVKGIDDFSKTFNKLDHSAKSSSGAVGKLGAVSGLVAASGVAALGVGLALCVKESMAAQKVQAQTTAVIKSTGGAAGVSAEHVGKLAGQLRDMSGVDDEVVQSGENMLLTFTNIQNKVGKGNDVFDQATKATLDLSVAMGKDMQSSAILVGKALQDPIKGCTALRKVGVQLTDSQAALIKKMVESGDVMGAQKVILAELNREFGGSAAAAGGTLAGKLEILKSKFGDLKQAIGDKLIPVLSQAVDWLNKHGDAIGSWAGKVSSGVKTVYDSFVYGGSWIADTIWKGVEKVQAGARYIGEALAPSPTVYKTAVNAFDAIYTAMEKIQGTHTPKMTKAARQQFQSVATQVMTTMPVFKKNAAGLMFAMKDVIAKYDLRRVSGQKITEIANEIAAKTGLPVANIMQLLNQMRGKITAADLRTPTGVKIHEMAKMIAASSGYPVGQVQAITNAMKGKITAEDLAGASAQKINEMAQAISASSGLPIDQVLAIMNALQNTAGSASLYDAGVHVAQTFASGLSIIISATTSAAASAVSAARAVLANANLGRSGGGPVGTGAPATFASGGMVGQAVPAIVHKGEFVMQKTAVQKYGLSTMESMNQGMPIPSKSKGGGETHVHMHVGAFMGSEGEARRFAKEFGKYLQLEGAR